MFKRIDHVELVPADLERSLKFYTEILGFKVQRRFKPERVPTEEIVFIELGGTMIEMFSVKKPAQASKEPWQVGCRRIALQVDDLDKTIDYLNSKGVEIIGQREVAEKLGRTQIKDPDGLEIELVQRR